jgi:hypothetical protein
MVTHKYIVGGFYALAPDSSYQNQLFSARVPSEECPKMLVSMSLDFTHPCRIWNAAFRNVICCAPLLIFTSSMFGANADAALIYVDGAAAINNVRVPRAATAMFPGDLLQTGSNSAATINKSGSSITVLASSLVEYQGTAVDVRHGAVMVLTSKRMAAIAGDVNVSPATDAWAEFDVVDKDGIVTIRARKGNLVIDDGSKQVTLAQGLKMTRDDKNPIAANERSKKKRNPKQVGARPAAEGGALNSWGAIGVGAGAGILLTTWVLMKNDNPASPVKP